MKTTTLHIWHHMGMGDFFLCNGIVRHYADLADNVILFYKHPYKDNVKRLYEDLNNVSFIDGGTSEDNLAKIWEATHPGYPLLKVVIDKIPEGKTFDEAFYDIAKLPFEYKWSKFHFERDIEKEKHVYYNILGLKDDEEFIFVHDEYRKKAETKQLSSDIKIIRPHNYLSVDIYDFLYTAEKSKEVHVMNSSFLCLFDCIQLKHEKLFYHQYLRPDSELKMKLNWRIIK